MKHGLRLLLASLCATIALNTSLLRCAPAEATGRELAERHCGNCHLLPEPALLDKRTWQHGVLPQMAFRLGMVGDTIPLAQQAILYEQLEQGSRQGYVPAQPVVTLAEWQRIVDYYVAAAPDNLHVDVPAPAADLTLFKPVRPAQPLMAFTTCIRIDTVARQIHVGDQAGGIQVFDRQLRRLDSAHVISPMTDVQRIPGTNEFARLLVGVMIPNDGQRGELRLPGQTHIDTLRRPVQLTPGDLNGDRRPDYVVCEFGNNVGQLSAFIQTGNTYRETVIDRVPGARRAIIRDCNNDGRADVVALLTQGDEQIAVYYGQQDGRFLKKTLLRFPSVNGSSYVELADMNRDGHVDIVYTNGDNADYSQIAKPYHGVHVYLNDGTFRFKKAWTYAMPGASQVLARDFDRDGDLDMAAISFFPILSPTRQQPAKTFIYFENQGQMRFKPSTWPGADVGRWLVMDAADLDGDGDDDIVLGSSYRSSTNNPTVWKEYWTQSRTGLLLLENELMRPRR